MTSIVVLALASLSAGACTRVRQVPGARLAKLASQNKYAVVRTDRGTTRRPPSPRTGRGSGGNARGELMKGATIESITVRRPGRGAILGLLMGAGVGAASGFAYGSSNCPSPCHTDTGLTPGVVSVGFGILGGALGAVVGALVGAPDRYELKPSSYARPNKPSFRIAPTRTGAIAGYTMSF
jgi:hypothetical protein